MVSVPGDGIVNHTCTLRLPAAEPARQLVAHLGPTLAAAMAGVRDHKLPKRVPPTAAPTPRPESPARLQVAHRAWVAPVHRARVRTSPGPGSSAPTRAWMRHRPTW